LRASGTSGLQQVEEMATQTIQLSNQSKKKIALIYDKLYSKDTEETLGWYKNFQGIINLFLPTTQCCISLKKLSLNPSGLFHFVIANK